MNPINPDSDSSWFSLNLDIEDNPLSESDDQIQLVEAAQDGRPGVKETLENSPKKPPKRNASVNTELRRDSSSQVSKSGSSSVHSRSSGKRGRFSLPSVKSAVKAASLYVKGKAPLNVTDDEIAQLSGALKETAEGEATLAFLQQQLREVSFQPDLTPAERENKQRTYTGEISALNERLGSLRSLTSKLRPRVESYQAYRELPSAKARVAEAKAEKKRLHDLVYKGEITGREGNKVAAPKLMRATNVQKLYQAEHKYAEEKKLLKEYKRNRQQGLPRHIAGAKRTVGGLFSEFQKYGGTGRSATVNQADTRGASPITWVMAVKDAVNFVKASKGTKSSIQRVRMLKNLVKDIDQGIAHVQAQMENIPPNTKEYQTYQKLLNESIAGREQLVSAIEMVPVGRDLQKQALETLKMSYSTTKMVQSAAFLITLLGAGSSVISTTASVAGFVAVPFGLALGALGLATTHQNMKQVKKTLGETEQIRQKKIEQAEAQTQSFEDLLASNALKEIKAKDPEYAANVERFNTEIATCQNKITEIESTLRNGQLSSAQRKNLVQQRTEYRTAISSRNRTLQTLTAEKIRTLPPDSPMRAALIQVQNRLIAKEIVMRNIVTTDEIAATYVQQKVRTKQLQNYIHLVADGMALAGTAVAGVGFITSIAGGSGMPLIAAGMVLGIASPVVRYGGGFLVRKVRQFQLGKDRVTYEQFEKGLKDRLKEEVENWDALEEAGYTEHTTASMMFPVMKEYYPSMAKSWGPKEWARSVAQGDHSDTKNWKEATKKMRYYDNAKFFNSFVTKWVDKLGRKIVGQTPGDIPPMEPRAPAAA